MRIVVHDYSGHPFQVQLSRELAGRGHVVRHIYSSSFQTPKGNLKVQPGDPETFDIVSIALGEAFDKGSFVKRRAQEIETGRRVAEAITAFAPDVVLSSNAPLDTQRKIFAAARRTGARFVFWLQDIYSEAIGRLLPRKLPVIGRLVAPYYRYLEFSMLRSSDRVVSISDDFVPILVANGVKRERIAVIENWAPLDEIVPMARDNEWARANMRETGLRIVYSGTLGYKHNPQLLLDIARAIEGHVHVFSEGAAASQLKATAAAEGIHNLTVDGWVAFADLPKMLAGADVFVAMIEEDAGIFSVPSKVLSYLAAGRPIAAAIPKGNLARRILLRERAGLVVGPAEGDKLVDAIRALSADPSERAVMGRRARLYAERAFDIRRIADRFEAVLATGRTAAMPQRNPERLPDPTLAAHGP